MYCTSNNNGLPGCHQGDDTQSYIYSNPNRTYDFEFESHKRNYLFPGRYVVHNGCHQDCRSVQENVIKIANFIRNFLGERFIQDSQNNVQNQYIASINVVECTNNGNREWKNAGWHSEEKQVLFGQRRLINGELCSYGTDITVVAHEFCHGIIQKINPTNPKDEINNIQEMSNNNHFLNESKAIQESFCDIFAILVRNYSEDDATWNDRQTWRWDVGENFNEQEVSLRCLDTMTSLNTTITRNIAEGNRDNHQLSLIHSHAFYLLMNRTANSEYLFDDEFALNIFGATVENPASDFLASRRAFESSARTLLRNDPLQEQEIKLQAIAEAFTAVGIE